MAFRQKLDSDYYTAKSFPVVYKNVAASFTTTGLGTLWTPATGKKFVLMGWHLVVGVDIVLAATGTDGVTVQMVDNAIATAFGPALCHLAPNAAISTNVESKGDLKGGWTSATANNVLKVAALHKGAAKDISTGYLIVAGTVWGREV